VYERALQALPGCFKIWRDYLKYRRQKVGVLCSALTAVCDALRPTLAPWCCAS
jgi:hypothetical protein